MELPDIDLQDRGTQVALAGAAIGAGLLISFLRGGNKQESDGDKPLIPVPGGWGTRTDAPNVPGAFGWVGSIGRGDIQNPPDKDKPEDPKEPDPDPQPEPEPEPGGKPYYCPDGYELAKESTGSGNDVCRQIGGTREIQVRYKEPPTTRYPEPAPSKPAGGPWVDDSRFSCPAGYRLARESTGSGNLVCRNVSTGREIRATRNAGGDGGPGAYVPGLAPVGGFSPVGITPFMPDRVTVRPNESLRDVARRVFGGAEDYGLARIARLNKDVIASGRLVAGQTLALK